MQDGGCSGPGRDRLRRGDLGVVGGNTEAVTYSGRSVELARATHETLKWSGVTSEDWAIVYSDTRKDPALVESFLTAASALAGEATLFVRPPQPLHAEPREGVRELLKRATIVIDLASNPWLYTHALNAVLDAGVRVLQVNASAASLTRLLPAEWKIQRAEAGASLFERANAIEITSAAGSHLTLRCDGRPGWGQDGLVRRPGDWDSATTSILAVAPLEDSLEGTLVIDVGDGLGIRPHRRRATSRVSLQIEAGRITSIEGDADADALRAWLASWDDPNSYVVSHTGFGGDPRASLDDPDEWESREGAVNLAFGSNLFRMLRGNNHARSHVDIVLFRHSMRLNGALVVDEGTLVDSQLRATAPSL
jgi:2,5-dihydroxypyridine 5,6-dioxygenase